MMLVWPCDLDAAQQIRIDLVSRLGVVVSAHICFNLAEFCYAIPAEIVAPVARTQLSSTPEIG